MKKLHPLFGFALCLSFVSFAPMSLIVDGRAPASNPDSSSSIVRAEKPRHQLFVFGPLIIYKRTERIKEVRVEYRRLQADVDMIANQKIEIERLIARADGSLEEVTNLKKELKKLTASHERTKAELEQLKVSFDAERAEMAAEVAALIESNEATEAEKVEALALLEQERSLAQNLSNDIASLTRELELKQSELAESKVQLEEAQAEIVAKEEELSRIRCENESSIALLKKDILKIEKEKNEITSMMDTMRADYEAQMSQQQMQQQQMMMAMYQFTFQAMLSSQNNPYLKESSLFDPNYQMMHMQQAQLLDQMYRQKYTPQVTNNYYGSYSNVYGSGSDFMNTDPMQNDHYSLFADNSADINAARMPSAVQPSMAPGYFVF